MAILKAPLFSFSASGKIAGALVYLGWKGLQVVRSYVIPSNPKTAAQNTQRGYMSAAVSFIHAAQGFPADPLDADDVAAYALLGSKEPTPHTWFNMIVKQWLERKVAGKIPGVYTNGSATPGATQLTVKMKPSYESGDLTSGRVYYGTSRTALINWDAFTKAELIAGKAITGLTAGVKYYVQFRALLPATHIGANSGIYYGVPTA